MACATPLSADQAGAYAEAVGANEQICARRRGARGACIPSGCNPGDGDAYLAATLVVTTSAFGVGPLPMLPNSPIARGRRSPVKGLAQSASLPTLTNRPNPPSPPGPYIAIGSNHDGNIRSTGKAAPSPAVPRAPPSTRAATPSLGSERYPRGHLDELVTQHSAASFLAPRTLAPSPFASLRLES